MTPEQEHMTPEQERHLDILKTATLRVMDRKYRGGAREHGGNLWDMPEIELAENIVDEAIDQVEYGLTLLDKLMQRAKTYTKGLQ